MYQVIIRYMKKALHVILDILAAGSLAGAYAMKYNASRRPGLVRWLNYNDNKLRETIPVEAVKYAALALAVILVAVLCVRIFRKASAASAADKVMMIVTLALTIFYAYVTFTMTYDVSKAAFLIVPLTGLAELLMIIRCAAYRRNKKDSQ